MSENNEAASIAKQSDTTKLKHSSSSSRSGVMYPRRRAVTACSQCRQRKKKCDNHRPSCGYCNLLQVPCTYDDPSSFASCVAFDHLFQSLSMLTFPSFDAASLQIVGLLHQTLEGLGAIRMRLDSALPVASPSSLDSTHGAKSQGNLASTDQSHSPTAFAGSRMSLDSPLSMTLDADVGSETPKSFEIDYLKIPSSRTNPSAPLAWPIFQGRYRPDFLQFDLQASFSRDLQADGDVNGFGDVNPLQLVENFLANVHIKNPILDVPTLRGYARRTAEIGFEWNGPACLVAIACALGCVSGPYTPYPIHLGDKSRSPHEQPDQDAWLQKAEAFYVVARRRIGLLRNSIITPQCYFFSAVYNMYRLRPLEASTNFVNASTTYQTYLKSKPKDSMSDVTMTPSPTRDMEDRLYWSCFKSECELWIEVPFPESGITNFKYPGLFPNPPNIDHETNDSWEREQVQTWYYYSTEITLRRIINRVLNTMYRNPAVAWLEMSVRHMVQLTEHFLTEITECIDALPTPIRYNEEDKNAHPIEELPSHVRARMLEIKCHLFRPFLFYTIHKTPSNEEMALMQNFVNESIACEFQRIRINAIKHRHHGTWLACRASLSSAFLVAAAVKSQRVDLPADWSEVLKLAVATFEYWVPDAPELAEPLQLLLQVLEELDGFQL